VARKNDELVSVHVKIPRELFDRLIACRDKLRKKEPMISLSDAIRATLEQGLK